MFPLAAVAWPIVLNSAGPRHIAASRARGSIGALRRHGKLHLVEDAREGDEILAAIGVPLDGPGLGDLQAECVRIAHKFHQDKTRVIGFVPSDDRVAVPPVMIHLGLALCNLSGATVAVVDANMRYPALTQVARAAADRAPDEPAFAVRWLRNSLALLTPPRVERAGEVVQQLARMLLESSDLFGHVLVDLTGFELLGEHGSAAACMDGVVIVGRAHHTREQELIELARVMPAGRFLGVLLVG